MPFTLTDGNDSFPTTQDNSQDDAINALGGVTTSSMPGTGNDTVAAGSGNDSVLGEDGGDLLDGNSGNDHDLRWPGFDVLGGQEDDDSLFGEGGNDQLAGAPETTACLVARTTTR